MEELFVLKFMIEDFILMRLTVENKNYERLRIHRNYLLLPKSCNIVLRELRIVLMK